MIIRSQCQHHNHILINYKNPSFMTNSHNHLSCNNPLSLSPMIKESINFKKPTPSFKKITNFLKIKSNPLIDNILNLNSTSLNLIKIKDDYKKLTKEKYLP